MRARFKKQRLVRKPGVINAKTAVSKRACLLTNGSFDLSYANFELKNRVWISRREFCINDRVAALHSLLKNLTWRR